MRSLNTNLAALVMGILELYLGVFIAMFRLLSLAMSALYRRLVSSALGANEWRGWRID